LDILNRVFSRQLRFIHLRREDAMVDACGRQQFPAAG
jgi:hypothetical protein